MDFHAFALPSGRWLGIFVGFRDGFLWPLILLFLCEVSVAAERFRLSVPAESPLNPVVCFEVYVPDGLPSGHPVLLLVPGCNGKGGEFLDSREWTDFADREGAVLLAPTFRTNLREIRERSGYYYPGIWSGKAVLDALEELQRRVPIRMDKIFVFGFSAGAHFAHRFALWRPDRVGAFVAYSAGWWDFPDERLKTVPALILCGEDDPRLNASLAFAQKGLVLGCPWIWRSYPGTGHELTEEVTRMARVFLAHYLRGEPDSPVVGDAQTYRHCAAGEEPPAICRVVLPSREIAAVWEGKP
jgi:predicted esterase